MGWYGELYEHKIHVCMNHYFTEYRILELELLNIKTIQFHSETTDKPPLEQQ